jgi:CRISPR-associated endonuclease/helicase Cas3
VQEERFWAHSARDSAGNPDTRSGWQLLAQHLVSVSSLAREFAVAARPEDAAFAEEAAVCGLLHDYGKYTECFQRRITTGQGPKCQHAIHGAQLAVLAEDGKPARPHLLSTAFAIAGHHGGLPDSKGDSASLQSRLKSEHYLAESAVIRASACHDCCQIETLLEGWRCEASKPPSADSSQIDLRTRMLFSCLVDADRLDSAGRKPGHEQLIPEPRLAALLAYARTLQGRPSAGGLAALRKGILDDCVGGAGRSGALFSLSVPTGGGKTLSSMAFALKRAALKPEQFRRIIVVIPYLSIIEQNAEIYARVFGRNAVLEHHSGAFERLTPRDDDHWDTSSEEEDKYQHQGFRSETENWDAPLIVTTSVRFFESLFSNRPSDLRRVHNIARSVIILDEVQTLPRRLLIPLLSMMKGLVENWGCNFVFSTATLPAFESALGRDGGLWRPGTIQEIVQHPEDLRRSLRRATIHWEIDQPKAWEQVAERMLVQSQALCVVNVRDHAANLYSILRHMVAERRIDSGSIFHLSTRMCAAHRLRRIREIKARLDRGLSCWVAATQLVEAGVDLDFPLVLRSVGPLESIIQAAGRADREGRLTAQLGRPAGEVIVFRPPDDRMPPNEYREATGYACRMVAEARLHGSAIQVDSADELRRYYERYYGDPGEEALGKGLEEMRSAKKLEFATLASEFEMINNRALDVFVPDDEDARAAIARLRETSEVTWELRRQLQQHSVGLLPYEFQQARGVLEELRQGSEVWIATDFAYSEEMGLVFEAGPESFVL